MEPSNDHRDPSGSAADCLSEEQRRSAAPLLVEKEHMFDKVVTPSDVGKLNRLVIPKQYAEKYFPLDASANEKGLLLSFEDRTAKSWRFRYSYWNSSQSYVMTKGWSRFVKEKRLDAGDTVSFGRGVGEAGRGRFFIDWRRRHDALDLSRLALPTRSYHQDPSPSAMVPLLRSSVPWGRVVWPRPPSSALATYNTHPHLGYCYNPAALSESYLYLRSAVSPLQLAVQVGGDRGTGGGDGGVPVVFDSVPVVEDSTMAKRVRLFGVNLDCPAATEDEEEGVAVGDGHPPPPVLFPLDLSTVASESPRVDKEEQPMCLDLM